MELQKHSRLGQYEVLGFLGAGAMASVYKVRHTELGSTYALKLLQHSNRDLEERLLKEGRAQAQLRHPNVVSVSDVVKLDGRVGLVMEYVDGPNLADFIADNHPVPLDQIDALGAAIIKGVRAAHKRGHVHRDLKPANILLQPMDDGYTPKIADFGLVKVLDQPNSMTATRTGAIMGSPAYMSPEQTMGSKLIDQRSDVWSVGAVLYQLCTARLPFEHSDFVALFSMVRQGNYRPPTDWRSDLHPRMVAAIASALTVDLERRASSCNELLSIWMGHTQVDISITSSSETLGFDHFGNEHSEDAMVISPALTSAERLDEPAPARSITTIAPRPTKPRRWLQGAGLALGAVGLVAGAAIAGAAITWVTASQLRGDQASQPVPSSPPELATPDAPVHAPEFAPPPAVVLPSAPTPPAHTSPPPDRPTTTPPSDAAPPPPRSKPTAPAPRTPPAPETPAPETPAPAREASVVAQPTPRGSFSVTGQAERVWLVRDGVYFDPGEVPIGPYEVVARFPGRPPRAIDGLSVDITANSPLVIECVAGFLTCRTH